MDTKKIALIGGMVVLAGFMFVQVKKLGAPAPVTAVAQAAPVVKQTPMSRILVSTQTILLGTRINEEMLEWQKWPSDAVSEVFIDQDAVPDALEQYMNSVARMEIAQGEPITARKLVQAGDRSVMSALLKPGHRAVTIRITMDTAAAGFINPGDKVDIILTRRLLGATAANTFTAETVFENVPVLSIDQTFTSGPETGAVVLGSMATFELTQEDAEILTIAQSSGDLSLTLRPMSTERARSAPSRARMANNVEERVATLTVYRDGASEQVVLKGQ